MPTLEKELCKYGLQGITNNVSVRAYKAHFGRFATWARENGCNNMYKALKGDIGGLLQGYADSLAATGRYSPATLHTYLAPICTAFERRTADELRKGTPKLQDGLKRYLERVERVDRRGRTVHIPLSKTINKPIRSADRIIRGRSAEKNLQGRRQVGQARYARVSGLQAALGIRRDELAHLRGRDLCRDEKGYLCVKVASGKNGKEQLQRILPGHLQQVEQSFEGIAPDQFVLTKNELANKINLHGMRADLAKEAYAYYADRLQHEPGYAAQLRDELQARYLAMRPGQEGTQAYTRYCKDLQQPLYMLRGVNRDKALAIGRPIQYNRLAVMATSVYHLSHWRADVTVINYLNT